MENEQLVNLREVIGEVNRAKIIHDDAALTKPGKQKKAPRNELLIPRPRLKMMKEKTLRVPLERPLMTTPEKVIAIFREVFRGLPHEEVHVLTLDCNLRFINCWRVGVGGLDHVHVEPDMVFQRVLATDDASFFIVGHNHPKTGDPSPSEEDYVQLNDLSRGGDYLRRPMRDFVIIGSDDRYYSHREKNYEL